MTSKKLKLLNSFFVNVLAKNIIIVRTENELFKFWQQSVENTTPSLILGGGSNVLFLENYNGNIFLNKILGISIKENNNAWYLHVKTGELWHNLVTTCIKNKIPGLENLALIPGCVGSAPIQNIGAYGVELEKFCIYVDVINLINGKKYRLTKSECKFGYRDSIFKHEMRNNYAIIAVGLKLVKDWQPILNYTGLNNLNPNLVTPKQIYDTICKIRRIKLPDPLIYGSAGSFFKNPVINYSQAQELLIKYPDLPYYFQSQDKIKISAGWLIDRCGLKGYKYGGAEVYNKQALILINNGKATSKDIIKLAKYIRYKVAKYFFINLEPEVRFINANGEVDAIEVMT